MKRLLPLAALLFLIASCATSPGSGDAGLTAIELATLRCNLYGEWQEQEPPGGEAVAGLAWRWFFFDDGSGVRVPAARGSEAPPRAFIWFLEGANLRISYGGDEGTVYRRIERWDADTIRWYDDSLNVTELLDRRTVGRRPARCESLLATSERQRF